MKVTGCLNNNLSRPSFGMEVDFHPDDMREHGVNLPGYPFLRKAIQLTNADPEVKASSPIVAYLKHESEKTVPYKSWLGRISEQVVDVWILVADNVKSRVIEIPRIKPKLSEVKEQLLGAVRTVHDRYGLYGLEEIVKQPPVDEVAIWLRNLATQRRLPVV